MQAVLVKRKDVDLLAKFAESKRGWPNDLPLLARRARWSIDFCENVRNHLGLSYRQFADLAEISSGTYKKKVGRGEPIGKKAYDSLRLNLYKKFGPIISIDPKHGRKLRDNLGTGKNKKLELVK